MWHTGAKIVAKKSVKFFKSLSPGRILLGYWDKDATILSTIMKMLDWVVLKRC